MTDQPANSGDTPKLSSTWTAEPLGEPCEDCAPGTGRAILFAFAFTAFVAVIAADFATGGKVTAWTAAMLAGLRRREAE